MQKESVLAVSAVWSGEKALLGITLFINEPCLKGRAYKFPGWAGDSVGWREPGAPEGCSGGMLGSRGHKSGRETVL